MDFRALKTLVVHVHDGCDAEAEGTLEAADTGVMAVHVGVDEAGEQGMAGGVDEGRSGFMWAAAGDSLDETILDDDVASVDDGIASEDAGVDDCKGGHGRSDSDGESYNVLYLFRCCLIP